MYRVLILLIALTDVACAQIVKQDDSLQEQIVPESFALTGSATASKFNWAWRTSVSYTVVNLAPDKSLSRLGCGGRRGWPIGCRRKRGLIGGQIQFESTRLGARDFARNKCGAPVALGSRHSQS